MPTPPRVVVAQTPRVSVPARRPHLRPARSPGLRVWRPETGGSEPTSPAVQKMLGHASAAMTLDVHSGLFDDDLDGVANSLDALPGVSPVRHSVTVTKLPKRAN